MKYAIQPNGDVNLLYLNGVCVGHICQEGDLFEFWIDIGGKILRQHYRKKPRLIERYDGVSYSKLMSETPLDNYSDLFDLVDTIAAYQK